MKSKQAAQPAVVERLFLYLCTLLLAHGVGASAQTLELSETELIRLASHPTWLRLLHVPLNIEGATDLPSEINSAEFFISGDRFTTAKQELKATVAAFAHTQTSEGLYQQDATLSNTPTTDSEHELTGRADAGQPMRCRFPARAYWLSYELSQPDLRNFSQCTRLNEWAKLDTLESLSLIMISGYFGNPASTFGHSLLRLNNNEFGESSRLLDLGINFGAQIPPGEPTLVYILRGLFGGYQSGFSDRTFYEHDQTYNRVEFRDRWEYTLNLTPEQRTLLVLHLWEITGKKFTYFFIHENCSYRLAELLELATNNEITENVKLWYAPVTLFHDTRRFTQENGERLFTDVKYVPSIETLLRDRMAALSFSEHTALLSLITGEREPQLEELSPASQQQVLSTALDYFEYQLAGLPAPEEEGRAGDDNDALQDEQTGERELVENLKQRAVQMRLALPPSFTQTFESTAERTAPSALDPPSVLNAGYGYKESAGEFLNLNYAAYQHKAIGKNTYQQSALVAFDLTLAVHQNLGVFVDSLDFIRARKTNAPSYYLPTENKRSWEVGVGLETTRRDCIRCLESFAEGFVGRSKRFGDRWLIDASFGGRLSSKDSAIELIPATRVLYSPAPNFSSELKVSFWSSPSRGSGDSQMRYQLDVRRSFGRNRQIVASFDRYYEFQAQIGFGWRW